MRKIYFIVALLVASTLLAGGCFCCPEFETAAKPSCCQSGTQCPDQHVRKACQQLPQAATAEKEQPTSTHIVDGSLSPGVASIPSGGTNEPLERRRLVGKHNRQQATLCVFLL